MMKLFLFIVLIICLIYPASGLSGPNFDDRRLERAECFDNGDCGNDKTCNGYKCENK
ncbi:EB domain-containing protein [Caenorhabditis elegans]|uniref:EB domain-containing protein n=1 Tax=Caenorhabditis elegans TaxID=6239 RepID=V6CLE0_CAEEL|nr:EB domain-containing protein [Caenorhabditis elegans]CDK13422.1 EB domain-containing protein [Caenorhabditis elegans]|eukprot:NP_001293198.1 Uncharacterized protein CELE_C54G6.8 [Caenorhabditis elegans]